MPLKLLDGIFEILCIVGFIKVVRVFLRFGVFCLDLSDERSQTEERDSVLPLHLILFIQLSDFMSVYQMKYSLHKP